MVTRDIKNVEDLEHAFNDLLNEIKDIHAEITVFKVLVPHLVGLMVRKANNPEKYFNQIWQTSRENISERVTFESGDNEANQKILEKALIRHDQIFEELRQALGFRKEHNH